jgi:hypothetical protein
MPLAPLRQNNEFRGSLSNERGLFMAGAQLNTGGGNITIIGGGCDQLPRYITAQEDIGGDNSARDLPEGERLCVLSLGE